MSNTMLFSSPLGQTYFSVLGHQIVSSNNKEISRRVFEIIKFYRAKDADSGKGKKKEKLSLTTVQLWSIFILLIINEYSIGRSIVENNQGLRETLTLAEISEVLPTRLDNYLNCVKIVSCLVEYFKTISSPKQREREVIIFIASFIKICSNSQGSNSFA